MRHKIGTIERSTFVLLFFKKHDDIKKKHFYIKENGFSNKSKYNIQKKLSFKTGLLFQLYKRMRLGIAAQQMRLYVTAQYRSRLLL